MKSILVLLMLLTVPELGIAHPKFSEKAIICGTCKNVEKPLPAVIQSIEKIGVLFSDYKVFIYENNSTDNTVSILNKWAERNSNVDITSESFSKEELYSLAISHTFENVPFRTEIIAYGRNIVMKKALESHLDDYTYVFMLDMDFANGYSIKGICDSLTQMIEWDAIFANGIDRQGKYYDQYALRDGVMPLGPELLGNEWWSSLATHSLNLNKKNQLKAVYSAFGGLGIYKRNSIKDCYYSGTVTDELEIFVKNFISSNTNHWQVLKYLNEDKSTHSLIRISNSDDAINWRINSGGYDFPVCCEHVTFHAMMINRGHDKMFINPKMIIQY